MSHLPRFVFCLLFSLCTALPACAAGNLVSLEMIDRGSNSPLSVYRQRGQEYVIGTPGSRYAVRLRNRSGNRVLVVLSVDGINVITGATASPNQSGYVLDPYASTEIAGWRKNMNETAAFYFTALADSYAARTDRPDNTGVIGAAIFTEQMQPRQEIAEPLAAAPARDANKSTGAVSERRAESADKRLGTGHGEREYAPSEYTGFVRASRQPAEILSLRYDSRTRLIAAGVIPSPRPNPRRAPEPFPGFVPDPA